MNVDERQSQVHFDPLTSGLESETHFRVEEKQALPYGYLVTTLLQAVGSRGIVVHDQVE